MSAQNPRPETQLSWHAVGQESLPLTPPSGSWSVGMRHLGQLVLEAWLAFPLHS